MKVCLIRQRTNIRSASGIFRKPVFQTIVRHGSILEHSQVHQLVSGNRKIRDCCKSHLQQSLKEKMWFVIYF